MPRYSDCALNLTALVMAVMMTLILTILLALIMTIVMTVVMIVLPIVMTIIIAVGLMLVAEIKHNPWLVGIALIVRIAVRLLHFMAFVITVACL